jgi:uroporphyrinogen decarboxylase
MVYIPGFLVNKVYERGSLQNTEDGFTFTFTNTMTPVKISGMSQLKITIDGEVSISSDNVELELGGRIFEVSDEPLKELVEFSKNSKLYIRIQGNPLSDGKHVLKISFITHEFGGVTLKVKDAIGEIEYLTLWQKIKKRFSRKKHKVVAKPIIIEGELGGIPLDPDFSRLEAVLRREQPDRVPLFEAEIEIPIKEAFLGREITTAEDDVEFYIRAGYDFVPVVPPFFTPRVMRQAEGDERSWITESEGRIKTMEDFEKFPWPDPDQVDFSSFHEIAALLPPKMKILGLLSPAAVFGNTSQSMGLQDFSYALFDNIELIEALFEKIGSSYLKIAKKLVTMPRLGAILMSDDLAHTGGCFVNPKIYRKYVFPWYREIGRVLENAGIPFIFHSDGNFMAVFNDLADCGIKAIHPIEPQAMDIVDVKKEYGDKFCIFGNIDLEYTLTRGTVEEVEAQVKQRLKELGPGGGYGLAASNSIPDYVKPENFKAMVEAARKYGKYPINIE